MKFIEGGRLRMGSDTHYPEEGPAHYVEVGNFWIDETPVTNLAFSQFVQATGYVTLAERVPDSALYPGFKPEMMRPGSLLFVSPESPVPLSDLSRWWKFSFGTDWKRPHGPESSLDELMDHPVVHIAFEDAETYAIWADKALPTEAEWEFAARGGHEGRDYQWGNELAPNGEMLANFWQGQFPWQNLELDGFFRTSPVRTYPPNDFGLFDMIGNVWEWTDDWFQDRHHERRSPASCCVPNILRGESKEYNRDPCQPDLNIGRKVLKGGSHLCAENYCQRYRPAARYPQPIDTSTSHVGFRCVRRDPMTGASKQFFDADLG